MATGSGRRPKAKNAGGLTRAVRQGAATTTKEALAELVDEVVDTVNGKVATAGLAYEEAANLLFRTVMQNRSSLALDPVKRATPAYVQLRRRAGHSLKLTRDELREFVIVGALNQRLSTTGWSGLGWSVKVELVTLVSPADQQLVALRRGVAFASRPGTSLREVQAWKQENFPQQPGARGRPRLMTFAGGRKVLAGGVRLGNEADRRAFAEKLRQLPQTEQRAVLRDLETSIENLEKLRRELLP